MNKNIKLFFLSILIVLAIMAIAFLFVFEKNFKNNIVFSNPNQNITNASSTTQLTSTSSNSSFVLINGHKFYVEVASTTEKQILGLSNRKSMPQDDGMLFVFSSPGIYPFWMNKMLFALDFVWINGDKIVDITEQIPPPLNGNPTITISPHFEVDKVLEINAGQIKENGIKIGQKIIFNIN